MRKITLAACAIACLAGTAHAQQGEGPGHGGHQSGQQRPERHRWLMTPEQAFDYDDANKDGKISKAEFLKHSVGPQGRPNSGPMKGPDGEPRQPMSRERAFDLIDTNHDGAITKGEMAAARAKHDEHRRRMGERPKPR